ncbi:hypothetical protein GCM10023200_48610 [Actinomycetospora chlora]|uniref:Uncharacterized protein n=1 Tax=Actinomycetospora chlora TaxID=663608 RepID=A0ABP9CAX2_9PSEU
MLALAGCASGPAGPPAPVAAASCPWTAPPVDDPAHPADVCGVASVDLAAPLARHADLLPVTVELSTDRALTCVAGTPGCAVEDDRRFVAAPAPDPRADPSRTRALLTIDWADDQVRLHVPPHCHLRGGPAATVQDCAAVPRDGVRFAVTSVPGASTPWRFHVALALPGDPGGAPVAPVDHGWDLSLDPAAATLRLTGDGTGTPALALLTVGGVRCAVRGAAPPTSVGAPPAPAPHDDCTADVPANP